MSLEQLQKELAELNASRQDWQRRQAEAQTQLIAHDGAIGVIRKWIERLENTQIESADRLPV